MAAADVLSSLHTRCDAESYALGVSVAADRLLEALQALRDVHGYRYYVLASATEWDDRLEIVHGVRHPDTDDVVFVKAALDLEDPTVDSAAQVYTGADWHEREIYDLFGVTFRGHPDPRRILMPDEYEGHPLRKAFAMNTGWGYRPSPAEPDTPEDAS